jgi:hypothetical protein
LWDLSNIPSFQISSNLWTLSPSLSTFE